jgi:hypothetical protein
MVCKQVKQRKSQSFTLPLSSAETNIGVFLIKVKQVIRF